MAELRDADIEEISLVDLPANRKKFLFIKQKEKKMNLSEIYKSLTGKDMPESIEKQIPAEHQNEIVDALAVLEKYKEDFPEELAKAISALIEYAVAKAPYPYPYPAKTGRMAKVYEILESLKDKDELQKEDGDLSEETKNRLLELVAAIDNIVKVEKKQDDAIVKGLETLQKSVTTLEKRLEAIENAKQVRKSLDNAEPKDGDGLKWPSFTFE